MSIVLDDKLEKHLDDALTYWQKIYFEYEQRAARIATAGGVLATLFGSQIIKASSGGDGITNIAAAIAFSGVVLIVGSSLFSLTIFIPLTHKGATSLVALRRSEGEENMANFVIGEISGPEFPAAVYRWANVFFWTRPVEADSTAIFRLRSKLTALSHFRRMSSLRSMRNLLAVWLLISGSLMILAAGAVQLASA